MNIKKFIGEANLLAILNSTNERPESYSACLELIAKSKGFKDWNTLSATARSRYFFDRHKPYRGCSTGIVTAMSVYQAVKDELATCKPTDATFGKLIAQLNKTIWQIDQAKKGVLEVSPALYSKFEQVANLNEYELTSRIRRSEQEFKSINSDVVGALAAGKDVQKLGKAYHRAYVNMRLAKLAMHLASVNNLKTEFRFESLVKSGVDVYGLIEYGSSHRAVKLDNSIEEVKSWSREWKGSQERQLNRGTAKAAMLSWISGAYAVNSNVTLGSMLELAQPEIVIEERVLEELYPEIAAWLVFCELKPAVAENADMFYARNA